MNAAERLAHWRTVRRGLLEAMDSLSDEQLAFVPAEGLWSLGTVARHIAEAEEGWFRHIVTGELPEWPEFTAAGYPTVDSIVALLTKVHDRTLAFLAKTDVADLDRVVDTSWDAQLPLSWIIWHVLEHEVPLDAMDKDRSPSIQRA
ncbi:MAG: DinB family protein [Anaerolineae bacterium]|nr:DinB family protein [Anaerolineae bacterium]